MKHCKLCLLPALAPGCDLARDGRCAECRRVRHRDDRLDVEGARRAYEGDLEQALRSRRGSTYDAVVCLSGGKDSLYLLYRAARDYRLRVLALTVAIDLPDVAMANIERAVRLCEVDHVAVKPNRSFCHKLFRHLLTHQEERGAVYTLSYVYAPLFESIAIRTAAERSIPLVLAGYSPGQPDPERMHYEFSRELIEHTDWAPPALVRQGVLSSTELAWFWNPRRERHATLPRYLAPFHAWTYDQAAIIDRVAALGLVAKKAHASPVVSNYPINWLMMYSDLVRFGYNPYAPEFAALIRDGRASRRYWRWAMPAVDAMIRRRALLGREVDRSLDWLGLRADELRITEPRGAYDPIVGGLRERSAPFLEHASSPDEVGLKGTAGALHWGTA